MANKSGNAYALYIDPHGKGSPFPIRDVVRSPYLTELRADHPLSRWVALKDLNIERASRFVLQPGDVAVASALKDPIVVARDRDGRKTVAIGFSLQRSDLPLRVAFPVLLLNALEWFSGIEAGIIDAYPTGRTLQLPAAGPDNATARVRLPDGRRVPVPVREGRARFYAERAGVHFLERERAAPRAFSVNLQSSEESRLAPRAELRLDGVPLGRPAPAPAAAGLRLRQTLWPVLLALGLFLAVIEWWTYHRRITV